MRSFFPGGPIASDVSPLIHVPWSHSERRCTAIGNDSLHGVCDVDEDFASIASMVTFPSPGQTMNSLQVNNMLWWRCAKL